MAGSHLRSAIGVMIGALTVCAVTACDAAPASSETRSVQPDSTTGPAERVPAKDAAERKPPLRVAFLGDSYVAGHGAEDRSRTRWTARVSDELGWREVNLGLGGTGYTTPGPADKATTFVQRVETVKDAHPDVVVVSGGRNDLIATVHRIHSTALELFRALKGLKGSPEVVVVAPLWDASKPPKELAPATRAIKDAAARVGVEFVPVRKQPLAGRPALMSPDGLHPDAGGYRVIAKYLAPRLKKAVGRPTRR